MLFGGLFLLFKATAELNERLEGKDSENSTRSAAARNSWPVAAQIVVLDARLLLDPVITAVGMVGPPCGDDGRGDYRHHADGDGQQGADPLCEQSPDHQ